MTKLVACIMAGGVGSRFWPASTEDRPKQFLDILGLGRSLLQLTYDRYRELGLAPEDIFVVTNDRYVDQVAEHLPDVPYSHIIGEPLRRNTAPAAYLGNKLIEDVVGDAIVVMAPSDHHIEDANAFFEVIRTGHQFLQTKNALITIGIKPTFPHTGYGYINFSESAAAPHPVKSFTEKPHLEKAKEFLASGKYLWNAGIFMWHTAGLNASFAAYSPSIKQVIDELVIIDNGKIDQASLQKAFGLVDDASIDYEIMERANNVYTIPASMKWSDLGSWKSLFDKSEKNDNDSVDLSDESLTTAAKGNLIFTPGKKVILKGLNNFMVIEDNDTLVICPMEDDQEVKKWRNHFVK